MPNELATILMRKSVGALSSQQAECSGCHRVPLAGELIHELDKGRLVCQLCLARLPESKRETIASTRVHVTERPLAVVTRAA